MDGVFSCILKSLLNQCAKDCSGARNLDYEAHAVNKYQIAINLFISLHNSSD